MKATLRPIRAGIPPALRTMIIAAALAFCFASAGMAQGTVPILQNQLLAKAAPDECFAGVGEPYPAINAKGKCPTGSVPKTNEAYVWGLTQVGTKLWFGTAPNVLCLVLGGFLGNTQPTQTESWVCEFGESQVADDFGLPAEIGDWRPPRAYVYHLAGKTGLTDITPTDPMFTSTLGLRSAGSIGDVVFLAGPAIAPAGVNFFAFKSSTEEYLASCHASAFSNIRQWSVIHNVLYAGVGNTAGGGGVIRWGGSEEQPFEVDSTCGFEVVGHFAGDAAYLTAYGPDSDRIAVSAWPNPAGAGVYISPAMDTETGLTSASADASLWTRIWKPSDYEPDVVTAATYGGGAIAYWDGALHFGTMHVPGVSALAHIQAYGEPSDQQEYLNILLNTYRAISIWRIDYAEATAPSVQLLYGESTLPAYNPVAGAFESTTTNFTPQYGSSGFGNVFNNYTWTAAVFQDRLLFGTMDWSYLAAESGIPLLPPELADLLPKQIDSYYGADLWRFDSPGPAAAEDIGGVGNYLNYGVRSMVSSPGALFIGTANPMNLASNGGWELRSLTLRKKRK